MAQGEDGDVHEGEVSTGSERDMAWIRMRSLAEAEHLDPVAAATGELIAAPAFPGAEIDRLRSQQRTALENQAQSPGEIARARFWETVYAGHPYGHDPLGTSASRRTGPQSSQSGSSRCASGSTTCRNAN